MHHTPVLKISQCRWIRSQIFWSHTNQPLGNGACYYYRVHAITQPKRELLSSRYPKSLKACKMCMIRRGVFNLPSLYTSQLSFGGVGLFVLHLLICSLCVEYCMWPHSNCIITKWYHLMRSLSWFPLLKFKIILLSINFISIPTFHI